MLPSAVWAAAAAAGGGRVVYSDAAGTQRSAMSDADVGP